LNISDATPQPALHGGDLRQSCELPVSISDGARAQEASASELNSGLLAQSAEALGVLASAAIAEQDSVVRINSAEIVPGPGTETFSSKRPLTDGDIPCGSEGHDSEAYRSPKRPRRSGFKSHSSPRLESNDICPIPADPRVIGSANQSSQVPGDSSPQFRPGSCVEPSSIASGHLASQSAELISMPTEQAESVRLELRMMQRMISSLLAKLGHGQAQNTLPDGSIQSTPETRDGTKGPAGDDSDDDSHSHSHSDGDGDSHSHSDNDSDGDGDDDSACDASEFTTGSPKGIQHRSTQRCKWTKEEEDLLRRLKNVGMLSDFQIARKLNRSENGVKQHWGIILGKNKGQV
jgi:DNA-binding CsgD family transcriptional regulator